MKKTVLYIALIVLLTSALAALPRPVGQNKNHAVVKGETLFTISRQYGLAPDHILWANGLSENHPLKEGDVLLIPLRRIPPFTPSESTAIVLNLPERMIYLFRGHSLAAYWGVAIGGIQYPTPTGKFRILAKEKDPTWEPPAWLQKKPIGPGPDNPLGDRWMQITPNMVGIHGTNNPDSIGGVASLGCVRLYPESVRKLFDQVNVGTPVYVTYEQVRVGQEPDGTLVWSFFPDPYTKYYTAFQAQEALAQAQAEGFDGEVSKFEIEERKKNINGLITPVFGVPLQVKSDLELPPLAAIQKPTGNWLHPEVLEKMGFQVNTGSTQVTIRSKDGKTAKIIAAKLPLNPYRLPRLEDGEVLALEGHRWRGAIWLPVPMVLEYFKIPHDFEAESGTLTLSSSGTAGR